jgi:sugar-specific transcriptional regulator TrmB
MDLKELEDIGLNKSEIKVYIALLRLGPSSAGQIVQESRTANSKVYEVLDKLTDKGLVTCFKKSKIKYYAASSPRMIKAFLEEKKQNIEEQSQKFEKILPQLIGLERSGQSSEQASIYSGPKGFKTVFTSIVDELKKGEEIHIMGVYNFRKTLMPLALHFQKMRSEKGIKAKFLINKDAKFIAREYSRYKPVEIRFMKEKVFTPAIFLIYKDKVIINLAEEMTFFVIQSKNTAKSFEVYFNILWSNGLDKVKK